MWNFNAMNALEHRKQLFDVMLDELNVKELWLPWYGDGKQIYYERKSRKFKT